MRTSLNLKRLPTFNEMKSLFKLHTTITSNKIIFTAKNGNSLIFRKNTFYWTSNKYIVFLCEHSYFLNNPILWFNARVKLVSDSLSKNCIDMGTGVYWYAKDYKNKKFTYYEAKDIIIYEN